MSLSFHYIAIVHEWLQEDIDIAVSASGHTKEDYLEKNLSHEIVFYLHLVSGLQSRNMNAKIIRNPKEASLQSTKLQSTIYLFKEKNFLNILIFWCHYHHHLLLLKMKPNWISPWTWTFPKEPSQRLSKLRLDSDLFYKIYDVLTTLFHPGWVVVFDTLFFKLNEYFVELNKAKLRILLKQNTALLSMCVSVSQAWHLKSSR